MNAALAPHAALFDSTVIDHLRTADTYRLTRSLAQEEPRTVMARFSLTLCSPVVHQLLEQTLTQGQDAPLRTLAIAYSQLHASSINGAGFQIPCFRDA